MKYDVIVIGAGPGGCGAAAMLKNRASNYIAQLIVERMHPMKFITN